MITGKLYWIMVFFLANLIYHATNIVYRLLTTKDKPQISWERAVLLSFINFTIYYLLILWVFYG